MLVRDRAGAPVVHPWLTVLGARHNNLKYLTVRIPLQRFVCVTGVSGSGKSSLVNDILREALARDLNGATTAVPGAYERIDGLEHLDKIIDIDQSPIGRTPRSNPATYIKVFDHIRALYTRLPDAKVRGYRPGRFSFNVACGAAGGGRCEACEGNGSNRMEMDFLADVWITCPVCNGRRFNRETLQILFKGKCIADVLEMDVQQALDHFGSVPQVADMLRTLHDVGLDYLKLGQSSTTLSGGEAQRIKLARELVKKSTGRTLYVLDEPTTGLHFADIKRLLAVLHGFVDAGHSVLVIEHNLDVIKTADWIIDLGPEGGAAGGRIVAEGTPEEVAEVEGSHTGVAIREVLEDPANCQLPNAKCRMNDYRAISPRSAIGNRQLTIGSPHPSIGNRQSAIANSLLVVGAQQHNLKDITVSVPRNALTVCCGPSGSGKSSFAVDTVYAEGQRRYVESLSAYARQFLSRLTPPRVEQIHGLSPAICIEQKTTSRSPRSTVGTITEVYDYMRVLWARLGTPHCPACRVPVGTQTSDEIVERILAQGEGRRALLLAPVSPEGQEDYAQFFARERANGFARARIDGVVHELSAPPAMDRRRDHHVELVIDRVVFHRAQASRLADSIEQALARGEGTLVVQWLAGGFNSAPGGEMRFSQHRACERCGTAFDDLSPHHFSFNTRMGWCEACEGLGTQQGASPAAIVLHPTRSLLDGALAGWDDVAPGSLLHAMILALAEHIGCDPRRSWNGLTEVQRLAVLHGCGGDWIEVPPSGSIVPPGLRFQWRGFFPAISRATQTSWQYRQKLSELVTEVPCAACAGGRLRPEPAAVRLGERTIHEVSLWPMGQTLAWFEKLKLTPRQRTVAGELLKEIVSRLRFLVEVGLDYLALHRTASTLSGGESQRIQLASQIGTGLTGMLYVLDEPTIGLHPRDNGRLIGALHKLRDLGNTLLLVEHDREVIDHADHVLDFGPGAGAFGGEVTAAASPRKLRTSRASLTGRYLSGKEAIAVPTNRRPVPPGEPKALARAVRRRSMGRRNAQPSRSEPADATPVRWLIVHGAREHNLKEIDVSFPLGRFTCVTGVSGSGKSTLVSSILYHALAARIHRASLVPGGHERISGIEHIDKVINVDQSPIGTSPMSNPATYTGVFDAVRELFARLPTSRIRGYTANRFSFNRPGGRCEACQGLGQRCIEMHFLPDVWVECENCHGARYVPETLEVRYRDKSIADVLNLRVDEALQLFDKIPRLRHLLQTLSDVGLGYVQLGQSAATLSGGEAQRVKLAAELGRPSTGRTLYILDEPTTGLHFDDLKKLLAVLHRLVDLGNTCICIEHNLDVIKTADWVIDLGPEAADAGGTVVVAGTPEQVAACPASFTGAALAPLLAAGPRAQRAVYRPERESAKHKALSAPVELGNDVRMPWERDGKTWHTVNHVDYHGAAVEWDPAVLVWLIETIERLGEFAPTDWNHRTRIEIKAPGEQSWFAHLLTGSKDLLEVAIRVPAATFNAAALARRLAVKTLDERADLPIYGQWSRVRPRAPRPGWQEVRLYLRDFIDVKKTTFRAFLKEAAAAYQRLLASAQADPNKAEPWKAQGFQWHLAQRGIHHRQAVAWSPALLAATVGLLRKLQPNLLFDWGTRTAGQFTVPGESAPAGKIVTNMPRGLRIELRTPNGAFTPAQVDRLGEDVEIKPQAAYDRVVFWLKTLAQCDPAQLREVWQGCRKATSLERTASA